MADIAVLKKEAQHILTEFKGNTYIFGLNVFPRLKIFLTDLKPKKISVILGGYNKKRGKLVRNNIRSILTSLGINLAGEFIPGARPNSPIDDVIRIANELQRQQPDIILSVGGGSVIDAVKCAIVIATLEEIYPDVEKYFGQGKVSEMLYESGKKLTPHIAIMTVAGSAAHLTKYSNITFPKKQQKLLIIDDSIIPTKSLFDYSFVKTLPREFLLDGAFDGLAHCMEVYTGIPEHKLNFAEQPCLLGIELILSALREMDSPNQDSDFFEMLGLGTDLGGYAIMTGSTHGPHLNSFSLTDIMSHGKACALLEPYYIAFFATAIPDRIRRLIEVFASVGYLNFSGENLSPIQMGILLAEGMIKLARKVGYFTKLSDVKGFSQKHIERCINAAKNPALESKLRGMPIPMTPDTVERDMKLILEAAAYGNLRKLDDKLALYEELGNSY